MGELRIIDIQRMSSEDGPGLRTTAFLKGCPLSCAWCHNPESISPKPQVEWIAARCIGCHICEGVCPQKGLTLTENGMQIARDRCEGCFTCAEACPGGAMNPKGLTYSTEELTRELLKDRAYFGTDGGITLSGGEALAQPESIELAAAIRAEGVSVAFDTCGLIAPAVLERALANADIILYDMKLADPEAHKKYTGVSNDLILKNLDTVCRWAENGGTLWIRTPIIPGATDSIENIEAIARILQKKRGIERWELCAFNNLCRDKYERLGIDWAFRDAPLKTKAEMDALVFAAQAICKDTIFIRATGAFKVE